MTDSDQTWRRLSEVHPYFGVLSEERFRGSVLDEETRTAFYQSGVDWIDLVTRRLRNAFPEFDPGSLVGVDFGCGVGRLLIPMAERCSQAIGVDVAPAMLQRAEEEIFRKRLQNCTLVEANDTLDRLPPATGWLNSNIVFQHIPIERGYQLLDGLLRRMTRPGYMSVQFTLWKDPGLMQLLPPATMLKQIETGEYILGGVHMAFDRFTAEGMSMYDYDMDQVLAIMYRHGFRTFSAELFPMGVSTSILILATNS